jgi:hypothetical protein
MSLKFDVNSNLSLVRSFPHYGNIVKMCLFYSVPVSFATNCTVELNEKLRAQFKLERNNFLGYKNLLLFFEICINVLLRPAQLFICQVANGENKIHYRWILRVSLYLKI